MFRKRRNSIIAGSSEGMWRRKYERLAAEFRKQLAGHSSLATTQRYIEGSSDAKRRIVDLIS